MLTAADAIDAWSTSGRHSDPDALADVAVTVAKAQLVAERLTISAAERLFDTGGASATARALNLDRHWRNARTVASHSPLAYKAYAAGNYAVNGVVAAGQRLLLSHPPPHPPPQPLLPPPLPPPADQRFLSSSCSSGVNGRPGESSRGTPPWPRGHGQQR